MSEVVETSKGPPRKGASGNGGQSQQQNEFNGQQDFSWNAVAAAGRNQQMEAYSNFYYPGAAAAAAGYSPFSGDIRDSIAAIWSRTSPSGEGFAAASGGYGGAGEGFAAAAAASQFAANLNFAPTSELSMFGAAAQAAAGDYSAAYGQYGFGTPQYTQWPENKANNYNYLDVQHGLESMKLKKENGSVGKSSKMSWASVASQPAKPQPMPKTVKKPGVLPPPAIIPSALTSKAPPAPQQTPSEKMILPVTSQPPPAVQQQAQPVAAAGVVPQQPPPVTPPMMMQMPVMNNHHDNSGFRSQQHHNNQPNLQQPPPSSRGGPPPATSQPSNPAPPRGRPQTNGATSNSKFASHPVLDSLRSSNEYNPKSFDLHPKNARYFVIKSFSEDDIHRSIKYEIWCSTDHGNKRLDTAFKEQNGQGPIFLFFSVNGSGHFCGMAEMLSCVDYSNTGSSVWVQDKFKGQFKVKWIFVKDVPNLQLRHIRLENNENKPVTNSRDTQEVPPDKGKMVLKIIHSFKHSTSLFDDFVHYEKKQEEEDNKKKEQQDHHDQNRHHGQRNHPRNNRNRERRGK